MNGISSSRNAAIGLPALSDSSSDELVRVLLDRVGQLQQRERPLARGRDRPLGRTPAARPSRRGRHPPRVDSGAWAITSPVAGLSTGSV